MTACTHRWARIAVIEEDGAVLYMPCLEPKCRAEMRIDREITEGPGMYVDGRFLDLEDDPEGGVVKIVLREAHGRFDDGWAALRPGDMVFDVGAHVGGVSAYLAARYPKACILAFEPQPDNHARLCRNIRENGLHTVHALSLALGTSSEVLLCGDPRRNSGGYSSYRESTAPTWMAGAMRLDDAFRVYAHDRGYPRLRLLKMDCEGAEYDILMRDEDVLDKVDFFAGEFHINSKLAAMGYHPDWLLQKVHRHIPPENVRVNSCQIGD